jgi:MarR family transcriptional regulator, transcriptional regulator for hemolysin
MGPPDVPGSGFHSGGYTESFDIKRFDTDGLSSYAFRTQPVRPPIGLSLTRAARTVSRAFGDALAEAGGSLPVWLVLLNLKTRRIANQRELAEAVGVGEATLTHHLNAMEADGLLTRRRDLENRRIHVVALTDAGEVAFLRLRDAAVAFDRRLRRGISAEEVATLEGLLGRLAGNVDAREDRAPPWAGLIERQP